MTDIVIPVFNEEKVLRESEKYYSWLKTQARIFFVDGASQDKTREIAGQYGRVICCQRGRAIQMNTGAALCRAPHILFLHVDTFLSPGALESIHAIFKKGFTAGCFSLAIDDDRWIFRFFEKLVNLRARRFKIIDGDLGLFVRKDVFYQVGRFDEVAVMEDILFSRKIRSAGRIIVLPDKIRVLSRRWHQDGFLNILFKYTKAYLRLWVDGGGPAKLHKGVSQDEPV